MATYKQIADRVYSQTGRRISHTCWIAHVLSDHGLTKRIAYNRIGSDRKYKCPPDRRSAIIDALQYFGMLNPTSTTPPAG